MLTNSLISVAVYSMLYGLNGLASVALQEWERVGPPPARRVLVYHRANPMTIIQRCKALRRDIYECMEDLVSAIVELFDRMTQEVVVKKAGLVTVIYAETPLIRRAQLLLNAVR